MNFSGITTPLFLSLLAGLSTVFGGLFFLFNDSSYKKQIGFFLGLSAGAMINISFIELLPYSIETIGSLNTNIYFFIGIVLMALIDFLLPHHYL